MTNTLAQVETQLVDDTLIKKSFKFEILDKNFKLTTKDVLFEAKLYGKHIFRGAAPSRDFAESRLCDLDLEGQVTHDINGEAKTHSFLSHDFLSPHVDDYSKFSKNLKAFQKNTSYKRFACGKSIMRVNSLRKVNNRRIKKFEKHFDLIALNEVVSNDTVQFIYPRFEMSSDMKLNVDTHIINKAYNRVLNRNADEYELDENLSDEYEKNWGYLLQEKLVINLEYEKDVDMSHNVDTIIAASEEQFDTVESFWLDHCLDVDNKFFELTLKSCKDTERTSRINSILGIENSLCTDQRRNMLESITNYVKSSGEKCIVMAKRGDFGADVTAQIEEIIQNEKAIKNGLNLTYSEVNSFYSFILELINPRDSLSKDFVQKARDYNTRLMTEIQYEAELFFKGYTDSNNNLMDRLTELRELPISGGPFPYGDPGWTDPVRPDYRSNLQHFKLLNNALKY
jgi:hypothetical protein